MFHGSIRVSLFSVCLSLALFPKLSLSQSGSFPPLVLPIVEPLSAASSSGAPYFVSVLPTISVGPGTNLTTTTNTAPTACNINVGIIRSLEGTYASWGQEMWPNVNLWVSHLASQNGIKLSSGVQCRINIVICDSGGTANGTTSATLALIHHPNFPSDFIITAESALAPNTLIQTEQMKIPSIVPISALLSTFQCQAPIQQNPPCTAVGGRRFNYGHTFFNMANDYLPPYFDQLRIRKVQTVAFFSNTATPWITAVCQAGLQSAVDNGMVVVSNIAVFIQDDSVIASVLPYLSQIANTNPDSLSICTNKCTASILALKQLNFMPKAVSTLACVDTAQATALGPDARYISGPSQWHYHLRGSGYAETPATSAAIMFPYVNINSSSSSSYTSNAIAGASPLQYYNAFKSAHNSLPPDYLAAGQMAALQALEGAISLSGRLIPSQPPTIAPTQSTATTTMPTTASSTASTNSTAPVTPTVPPSQSPSPSPSPSTSSSFVIDREAVNNQLANYYERSFFGTMSQSIYGFNVQKISILIQLDADMILQLISPASSADTDMIFPIPTWSERVYSPAMFATALEQSAVFVVCFVCLLLASLCIFIFLHRRTRSIRAISPPFSILLIVGAIISCCGTLTWVIVNNTQTCQARMWLLPIGFQLMIGPLLAKTERVARIFDSKKIKVHRISDRDVLLYVLACLFPQLLLSLLWSTIAPLTASVVVVDPLRPSLNLTICALSTASTWLAALTLIYCGCSLVYALYLAYRVRKAYAELDESRPIFAGVYMFALITVLVVVVELAIGESNESQIKLLFAIRTFGYIIALLTFLFILFGFRVYDLVSANVSDDSISSSGATSRTRAGKSLAGGHGGVTVGGPTSPSPNSPTSAKVGTGTTPGLLGNDGSGVHGRRVTTTATAGSGTAGSGTTVGTGTAILDGALSDADVELSVSALSFSSDDVGVALKRLYSEYQSARLTSSKPFPSSPSSPSSRASQQTQAHAHAQSSDHDKLSWSSVSTQTLSTLSTLSHRVTQTFASLLQQRQSQDRERDPIIVHDATNANANANANDDKPDTTTVDARPKEKTAQHFV